MNELMEAESIHPKDVILKPEMDGENELLFACKKILLDECSAGATSAVEVPEVIILSRHLSMV